jgi:ssDNA thymidine ADP-ribosyltransferase, DarT
MLELTPEKARIFRITHVDNVPWILANGLHCCNSACRDPKFRQIGNPDLINKRAGRVVPIAPRGTLSNYVPFYFTPHSPMLLNIKTGYNGVQMTPMADIAIIVTSLHKASQEGLDFVFTDRHAYVAAAQFSRNMEDLSRVDWALLQSRDFKRDPDDPGKCERYQAEALIHEIVPVSALSGIVCHGLPQQAKLQKEIANLSLQIKVVALPGWYF